MLGRLEISGTQHDPRENGPGSRGGLASTASAEVAPLRPDAQGRRSVEASSLVGSAVRTESGPSQQIGAHSGPYETEPSVRLSGLRDILGLRLAFL